MRIFLFSVIILILSCAKSTNPVIHVPPDDYGIQAMLFGTDSTFEVLSWNIENFPKNSNTTVEYAARILQYLSADVVAVQEIGSHTFFNNLMDRLNELDSLNTWYGYSSGGGSAFLELGYLIKTSSVEILQEPYEIYQNEWLAFPREPLIVQVQFEGRSVYVINNHYKCCGDGVIEWGNDDDDEYRRVIANQLLYEYINEVLPNENVIMVGDMNDEIQESQFTNVFWDFIDDPDNYRFADMDIAQDNTKYQWSYPGWPSHLDHILITNDLFDEFASEGSLIQTIRVDDYLDGGWSFYDNNISDHRPVGIKLLFP